MATNTITTKPTVEAEEPTGGFDRQEVTRIFAKLRHERDRKARHQEDDGISFVLEPKHLNHVETT